MPRKGGVPENLKPLSKDDPRRNKNGRPKKLPLLELAMAENITVEDIAAMIIAMKAQVKKGNVAAFNALMDRGYGRVKQPVDISLAMPDIDKIDIQFK